MQVGGMIVTDLQQSAASIASMLRTYEVRIAFSAKQVGREPLWMESFEPGALLLALRSNDGYTTFCRQDEPAVLDRRPRFTIRSERFVFLTEAL